MQFVKQIIQNFFTDNQKTELSSPLQKRTEILSSDILFGVVDTSDRISDPVAAGICRNLSEFWMVEIDMRGHNTLVKSDMDSLLLAAAESSAKYLIATSLGGLYSTETEFFDEIKKWLEENPHFFVAGHVLDRKEKWYELHDQCFILNLQVYRQLGSPAYGAPNIGEFTVPAVRRSEENFHDDYTPHWIKPIGEFISVKEVQRGHQLLAAGLVAGYEILAFPEFVRRSKYFLYPTVPGEFSRKIARWETQTKILTQGFYSFNTETMRYPVGDPPRPLKRLITLCSGLLFFEILRNLDFLPNTKVNFYDGSPLAIHLMRLIVEKWDGTDYPQFLKEHKAPETCLMNFVAAEGKWQDFMGRFGGEEEWKLFFKRVKENCLFSFSEVNIFSDDFTNQRFFNSPREEGETLLWLSNVFHYRYTCTLRSLADRVKAQDQLLLKLQKINPEMLIHMTSALGNRGTLAKKVFRAKEFVEQSENVPNFWTARSSRYPLEIRSFFLNQGHHEMVSPRIPKQFKDIQLDRLEEISEDQILSFAKWIEYDSLIPWLKLDLKIPHKEMLSEAKACHNDFVPHRSDHNRGWSSLCIHGISSAHTEDYNRYGFQSREDFKYHWTEIAERCPVTVQWLKEQWPMGEFDRVRYMLLNPEGLIFPHNDMDGKRGLSAVNIALNQPDGCEMIFEKYGKVPWREGDVRRLDVGVNHSVYNGSKDHRYHIIVHGRVGDSWKTWNRLIVRSFLKQTPIEI
jgi:hypothetical protein